MPWTGLPFSPHSGQGGIFSTDLFVDEKLGNALDEQQSDIRHRAPLMGHFFDRFAVLGKSHGNSDQGFPAPYVVLFWLELELLGSGSSPLILMDNSLRFRACLSG